tara:strand:- start:8 stop:442 length:435 start_codon:yes stop_codon:yes gene_type:complete
MEENKEIVKIPMKEMFGRWMGDPSWRDRRPVPGGQVISYDFDKLERDLIKNGQTNPITVKRVVVNTRYDNEYTIIHDEFKYVVIDGNHRCHVFNKLYGEDYEVSAYIIDPGTQSKECGCGSGRPERTKPGEKPRPTNGMVFREI